MTAKQLLAELRESGCEPGVDGVALTFETDPPDHLAPFLEVLHTGVRALLTGRAWYGYDTRTGKPLGIRPHCTINPAAKLPHPFACLCVAGDPHHDRVHPFAAIETPDVFEPQTEQAPSRKAVAA